MISIIVPVYNTAPYLDECIQSLVDQTYKNLEIILIDDGSKDGSQDIIKHWAEKDQRIRPIFKEKNSGVSDSRNIGLRMMKGDYVGFVDSDDWIATDMYADMHEQIEKTGADIVFSGYTRIEKSKSIKVDASKPSGTVVAADDALLLAMPQRGEGRYNLFLCDKLFRKSAFYKNGVPFLFDPVFSYCEDVIWLTHVSLNSKTVVFCQNCGYNYRTSNDGNTWTALNSYNSMKHCISAVEANQQMLEMLREAGSKAANNQLQRVLHYQQYAFRTAAKQKDHKLYLKYRKNYYSSLLNWYRKNKTKTGFKWLTRQIYGDVRFQVYRLMNRI